MSLVDEITILTSAAVGQKLYLNFILFMLKMLLYCTIVFITHTQTIVMGHSLGILTYLNIHNFVTFPDFSRLKTAKKKKKYI